MNKNERDKYLDELLDSVSNVDPEAKKRILDKVNRLEDVCQHVAQEIADMTIEMDFHKAGPQFIAQMLQGYCTAILQLAYEKVVKISVDAALEQQAIQALENNPNLKGN